MLRKHYNNNESPSARVHLAALFFLILGFAGCTSGTQTQQNEADSTTIRVGVLPTQECMRLFYAERMGTTDSLGLRLVLFRSIADIDTALASGSVDIALTDTARLAHLAQDTLTPPLYIIRNARDSLWLVASDSSKVRGAGGFKDKLIGMLRYSDAQTAANNLAHHAQYQEGEVFFIQVADLLVRYQMLTSRLLDAAFLPHPYSDAAIALGHLRIKLPATDTLCQGVWVARQPSKGKYERMFALLDDTTSMQADTLRSIRNDIYLLPQ